MEGIGNMYLPEMNSSDADKQEETRIDEIKEYPAKNVLSKLKRSSVAGWWKKYSSIPFLVAVVINVVLLLLVAVLLPTVDPIVKIAYGSQIVAGTLALIVSFSEVQNKRSKLILIVAIEIFILGMFAQLLSIF